MEFAAPAWLFPLLAIPGVVLALLLYRHPPRAARRPLPPALFAAAWLLLALLVVSPRLAVRSETWHPPVVLLVLDESASHRATGAVDAGRLSMRLARARYEAAGFRVVATSLETSPDPEDLANLRAVLLWTDGRFSDSASSTLAARWSAPVHPVAVEGMEGMTGEVQGESALLTLLDVAAPGGPALEVSWRSLGGRGAVLELRDGARVLHRAALPPPPETGARVTTRLAVPGFDPDVAAPFLLLRAADDAGGVSGVNDSMPKNDTVPLTLRGLGGPRHLFARPLVSLEERALFDALRTVDERSVAALDKNPQAPARGDVVWVRASAPASVVASARTRAASAGVPVVAYGFASPAGASAAPAADVFGADARLAWRADGDAFLPAAALRLADALGAIPAPGVRLPAPGSDAGGATEDILAWAEEEGRRAPLLWRRGGGYGVVVPSLWDAATSSAEGARVFADRSAVAWTRGVADWIAARGGARVVIPDPVTAGRPFVLKVLTETSGARGVPVLELREALESRKLSDGTGTARRVTAEADGDPEGAGFVRYRVPPLAAGRYAAVLARAGTVMWSDTVHVRDPRDLELSRLGADREGLTALAVREGTALIRLDARVSRDTPVSGSWPAPSGGQIRDTRTRAVPLAPALPVVVAITVLLGASWMLGRRVR